MNEKSVLTIHKEQTEQTLNEACIKPTAVILGLCYTDRMKKLQQIIRDVTGIDSFQNYKFVSDSNDNIRFKTAVIFYKGSRSRNMQHPEKTNPFHGNISVDMLAKQGALSRSMIDIDPNKYKIVDSEIFSTDILYIIFGGFAAGLGFGISKLAGSILEEAGKDIYHKIKNAIKGFKPHVDSYLNPADIVEICIQIEDDRYLCFFNPDLDKLDEDFEKIYQFLLENKSKIKHFDKKLVDLESLKEKETIGKKKKQS